MRNSIIVISLTIIASCGDSAVETEPAPSRTIPEKSAVIRVCEIVREPNNFLNEAVKVRAAVRKGFEFFEMYSLECTDPNFNSINLEYTDDLNTKESLGCEESKPIPQLSYPLMGGRTYGVDAVGKLEPRPNPPYIHPFRYAFVISCLNSAVVLDERGYIPSALVPEDRVRIETFENSAE